MPYLCTVDNYREILFMTQNKSIISLTIACEEMKHKYMKFTSINKTKIGFMSILLQSFVT